MTDEEERMIRCVARMAATLEAGDRAAQAPQSPDPVASDPQYYARRARLLYDAAEHEIAHAPGKPTRWFQRMAELEAANDTGVGRPPGAVDAAPPGAVWIDHREGG